MTKNETKTEINDELCFVPLESSKASGFVMKPRHIVKDLWASSKSDEGVNFEALVDFFQNASQKEVLELENLCRKNDWDGFRNLIMKARVPFETGLDLPPPSIDDPPNYLGPVNHKKSKS